MTTEQKTERAQKANAITEQLAHYNGTDNFYGHFLGGVYTDGVKAMGELCGAHWLIDLIFSHQRDRKSLAKIPDVGFQAWRLTVKDGKAVASCDDGGAGLNGETTSVIMQRIPYTDFPLDDITLYLIDGTLMLPSEY